MKKNLFTKVGLTALALGLLSLNSCKKSNENMFDRDFTGIYFNTDSIYYSFGITDLNVKTYDLKIPVKIMGAPTSEDRIFSAEIVTEKTTAVADKQYNISSNSFIIPKDSINGYIPFKINRDQLGTNNYKVTFKLVEKNGFVPVNNPFKTSLVYFNNNIEKPTWKSTTGVAYWPTSQAGAWNPLTYLKFIEYFRAMEQKAPETYANMVKLFGKDLSNLTNWPFDYDAAMTKYVRFPLYTYFMVDNKTLGVTIPKPPGY